MDPSILPVAGIIALVVGVAIALSQVRRTGPRRARPGYLGPDPSVVEEALRRILDAERGELGTPALSSDDGLDELARHHAHWMSVAGRCDSVDDQGRDVEGRRRALIPAQGGGLEERIAEVRGAQSDAGACARQLRGALDADVWRDAAFSAGAVGIGLGPEASYACLVLARRQNAADSAPEREPTDG